MTYKINIVNRILFKNGDYAAIIKGNTVCMVFEKPNVAKSTYKVISNIPQKEVISEYDDDKTIKQIYLGFTEREIYDITIQQLDSAIKNKLRIQKLLYTVEELK